MVAGDTPCRDRSPMRYEPLRDYGLIGDMRSAALVSRRGSIDWCCLPRFDSPSVFARILDHQHGGYWSVAPSRPSDSAQRYEEGTQILVTTFRGPGGTLELTDLMPVASTRPGAHDHREIHRRLEVTEGEVEIEVRFRPGFDYGRRSTRYSVRRHGLLASDDEHGRLALSGIAGEEWSVAESDGEARALLRLRAGDRRLLVLRHDDDEVWPIVDYGADRALLTTRSFWRRWASGIRYEGPHRALVERSALLLKALVYAPTGAVVAAPTTSLPEAVGGGRNWDYRFSWLRDSAYGLFALHALGKYEELESYMAFLKKVARHRTGDLQVLFGVEGERELPEEELDHLEGYRRSRPVRTGNGAARQLQLDIYGEVLDAVHIWRKRGPITEGLWELCCHLADEIAATWRRPDRSIWEVRGPPRHFVFSKVMCWVGLDRAIRAARELGLPGNVNGWRRERDAIRREVLGRGWNAARGTFVQHYDTDRVDASGLFIPLVRFLPADDSRVRATVARIQTDLGHDSGLLYRYRGPDGLDGQEGAFWMNSFNLVQALALQGNVARAEELFERAVSHAGPLGLFSEQVDPATGEMLGNYPQALTHIGIINAAHVLERARSVPRPATAEMLVS